MNSTKVNILSPGRFHVCDLARELVRCGFDVKFYSFVPTARLVKFGLPRNASFSFFYVLLPFLLLSKRLFPTSVWAAKLCVYVQDWLSSVFMRKCDVCISMSGVFVRAPKVAKRGGAIIIVERGSKHIVEQKRILDALRSRDENAKTVPQWHLERELRSYAVADYFSVAAKHVAESMMANGIPKEKLFVNPYGVNLAMFHPDNSVNKDYDLIMVGGWSYRKGCDIILSAVRQTKYRILHVGSIVDVPFPTNEPQFTHVAPVDESELVTYYNRAKVFVLPSREEGLALVQAQALACNLPIIGSKDSGAEDLREMVDLKGLVTVLKDYEPSSLVSAINEVMEQGSTIIKDNIADGLKTKLSWEAYGNRYSSFLKKIVRE